MLSHIKSIHVRRKIKSRMSFGARPSMSRSRSTPRLSRSGSGIGGYPSQRPETGGLGSASAGRKSRVDNTFQCDHGLGGAVSCGHVVRDFEIEAKSRCNFQFR